METYRAIYRGFELFLQGTQNDWALEVRDHKGEEVATRRFTARNLEEAESIAKEYVDSISQ